MTASPPHRRRTPLVAALGVLMALSACTSTAVESAPPSFDGLLLLTGDLRASTSLEACVGSPCRMEAVDAPDGTTWVSSGVGGELVATLVDATLRTRAPTKAGSSPAWREPKLADATGTPIDGPFAFPSWDPSGDRFVAIAGQLDAGPRLAVVDAFDGTTTQPEIGPSVLPAPPVWAGGRRVVVVTGTDDDLMSEVVDVATGSIVPGPAGARLLATSADARFVAVAGAGNGPVTVRVTTDWLGGGGPTIASIQPPDGAVAVTSLALDLDGSRLAIAWQMDGGAVRVFAYARLGSWAPTDITADRNVPGAVVAWSR